MINKILKYISDHRILSLAIYFSIFLLLVIGFVHVADEVLEGETLGPDKAILYAINGIASPFLNTLFVLITELGGVLSIITISAGLLAILVLRRKYQQAFVVAATVGGAALLNFILKLIFERTRPDLWERLVTETSYSFPSGHAMISSALALSVIFIFWKTRYRWLVLIIGVLFVAIIGFSRLYLGVHYPTDILAGWIVSAAWLAAVVVVVNAKDVRKSIKK